MCARYSFIGFIPVRVPPPVRELVNKVMSGRGAKDRQKQYKKGIDTDAARRNREETTVQLRKSKREDSLQKRRKDQGEAAAPMMPAAVPEAAVGIADLQQLIAGVSSNDRAMQRESTVKFRKLLSIGARRE